VALKDGACIQEGYPLSEKLVLYIHPTKPVAAMRFAEFAIGPEGSKIAEKFGLVTPFMQKQAESGARLAQMKSGKGIRISAIGPIGGGKAVPDLAIEYVKAKATVQMGYAATDSDVAAIGAFARAGVGATSMPAGAVGSAAAAAPTSMPTVRPIQPAQGEPGSPQATAPAGVPPMTPFVAAGGKELLFLADKPSARAMELHGQKWNALGSTHSTSSGQASLTTSGRDANGGSTSLTTGQPNGTGPAEYLLAGRAAVVVVNPANKIDALTIGQLQAIFGGEVADWGTLGSTGLRPEATPRQAGSGQGISRLRPEATPRQAIKVYGLRSDDLATGIFEKECLERAKWKKVAIKKDSAEVLAAVSMDPQAIGFVDLAGIPATGQNVRILRIRLGAAPPAAPPPAAGAGTSPRGRGVAEGAGAAFPSPVRGGGVYYPTPENIKNAMYTLSQRLWLYVHPQASDTAKDFVKFIATCGASEASPYADTVKAVMDTYRKNGLVPLADAALVRMTKDAMAADAARAKAEEGKGRKKK
jgi:ABC-type phosphate transport system substrate-binding protein